MPATIGMSTASATICSIVASKSEMTDAANMAVNRLTSSQGTPRTRGFRNRIGQFFIADAAQTHDVFFGLFLINVNDVINGEDTDETPVLIDDGSREQVILLEELAASSCSISAGMG